MFSHVWLFAIAKTVACQAPLSMGLPRQEYWSGLHFLLQGIFPTQGQNPCLLCLLHWQVVFFFFLPLAPPEKSMGFARQEYWSGLPFPFPGNLPNPGIEPWSSALQADALPSEPPGIYLKSPANSMRFFSFQRKWEMLPSIYT